MRLYYRSLLPAVLLATALAAACGDDGGRTPIPDSGISPLRDGGFFCVNQESEACLDNKHYWCELDTEFLSPKNEDCTDVGVCVPELWCVVCFPGAVDCQEGNAVQCRDDGSGWDLLDECDISAGNACINGQCKNLCAAAVENRSYVGCEFYAADLDNAAIGVGLDASAQQYAIVVSNPGNVPSEVTIEINEAAFGSDLDVVEVDRVTVLPGDLEVFRLPRREVDGSSSNARCLPDDRTCPGSEVCLCSSMDTVSPCFCRVSAASSGMNDGTHTAVTSAGYRIRSDLPIIAYQFNPLDNVGVFSNDASLLLPTSAIDGRYTVAGWPQTIANDDLFPEHDFDSRVDDEDLRATLTILGTMENTTVNLQMGQYVHKVVGAGPVPELRSGDTFEIQIGPFDVINLETEGLNADFTGTVIDANLPVAVFTGSEASDAPRFDSYENRQCCADHLEEQLFPDRTLGQRFLIGRMPRRSTALNAAFLDPLVDSVAEPNEPEWVRVVAVAEGRTEVTTTLPSPDQSFSLDQGENMILRADQDFILDADQPLAVLQVLPSQAAVGIPNYYPGGDPAIIAVPPTEQYRQDYVFLTPDLYAFDFVTITGPENANILLDGEPLNPAFCTTSPADGIERLPMDPPPDEVVHRCQFSYPDVIGLPNVRVEDGLQNDGVHTVLADRPVGVIVYGFDSFVSYAYAAGLNLEILN